MMDRMFEFINEIWNPIGGECPHKCVFCWARKLASERKMQKYQGGPRTCATWMKHKKFTDKDFVFVQDMTDLFASTVSSDLIKMVLEDMSQCMGTFLLLTKNPRRFSDFNIPINCVLGATIETNGWVEGDSLQGFYREKNISQSPIPDERLEAMIELRDKDLPNKLMISIEPILDFDFNMFLGGISLVFPDFVVVGYDNYDNHLSEPSLEKTEQLIGRLEGFTEVYRKSIRRAWWEK